MDNSKHIVIIGGGITGLSAAWELQGRGHTAYTLLEQDSRWGGKVITAQRSAPAGGNFIIDGGPESFITRKPEVWELAHELGIQHQLATPGSETSHMFILTQGKPLAVPLNPVLFLTSPILSARGKLRMLVEPFCPPRRDGEDESLAEFVTRRLGREALDRFIGPVLAGIYNTDPERQSILTTSPIMREMEAEYGGLFKAVLGRRRKKNSQTPGSARPRFVTFSQGAEDLVSALVSRLQGVLRLSAAASRIDHRDGAYLVSLADGETLVASAVILAAPANRTAGLLAQLAPQAAQELGQIRHENIGTATLAFNAGDVHTNLRVHGLMVPRREKRAIDAITFTSLKMPARAPAGYTLIRFFFGGSNPHMVELDDAELKRALLHELEELLGVRAEPVFMEAFRWPQSFPQADVGHLSRLAQTESHLPGGLYLAGSSYRGIGVPDCIQQGRKAAAQALQYIQSEQERKPQWTP
jgi:protoporphyrinogen/coproporphyrinogen III oxidase